MALTDKLTAIANAIRSKTGKTGKLSLDQMVTEIGSMSGGGGLSYVHEIYSNTINVVGSSTTSTTYMTLSLSSHKAEIDKCRAIIFDFRNVDMTSSAGKFYGSFCVLPNKATGNGFVAGTTQNTHNYTASNGSQASTTGSYGFYPYNFTSGYSIQIRMRTYSNYFNTVDGTYNVRVFTVDW